ncbi:hypothetical protein T439DRAFT_380680 [Meredithblackwellia eburnea MCA 4105]
MSGTISNEAAQRLLSRLPLQPQPSSSKHHALPPSFKGKERAVDPNEHERDLLQEIEKAQMEKLDLLDRLRRVVEELDTPLKPEGGMHPLDKRIALLEQEAALLQAQLTSLTSYLPAASDPALKTSSTLVAFETRNNIQQTIKELMETVKYEVSRGVKDRAQLQRDLQISQDASFLRKGLSARVEAGRKALQDKTAEDLISKIEEEANKINDQFRYIMGALVTFIDERLAAEWGEAQDAGQRKGFKPSPIRQFFLDSEDPEKKALELKFFLEQLMNSAVQETGDAWMSTTDVSRELVDFLHRARVIRYHPKDDTRVSLLDFGSRIGEDQS